MTCPRRGGSASSLCGPPLAGKVTQVTLLRRHVCVCGGALYYLTGVSASFQKTGTDHVFGYLERIGVEAGVVTQERDVQALQFMWKPR